MKRILVSLAAMLLMLSAFSQPIDPVSWSFESEYKGDQQFELTFKARIDPPWHLYSAYLPAGGPIATAPSYSNEESFEKVGKLVEVTKPKIKFDEGFQMRVGTIDRYAEFTQLVKITGEDLTISGEVEYQVCDDANCLPPAYAQFSFDLKVPAKATSVSSETAASKQANAEEISSAVTNSTESNPTGTNSAGSNSTGTSTAEIADASSSADASQTSEAEMDDATPIFEIEEATMSQGDENAMEFIAPVEDESSIWRFFWIAFGAGLLALLTPCVFPMIPMTVSFFMQGSEKRGRAIFRGSVFGISIIAIYTLLGVLVSVTNFGPNAAAALSTNWILNLVFFLLFVIFAFSFFGMFELVLPSKWVNRADQGAEKGGLAGAFFMALTTVLVSFSCTGPIVGALLVEAAGGLALKPILGMFGFGLAFAIPFTLFAIFPSMLKGLPKSGGWLNGVKVVLGFVVLAFSFKFLYPIDPAGKVITRELVLIVWTVLFFLLGVYLLGKLKFAHDSDLPFVKVPRFLLSIIAFVAAIYMFTGIFGANLGMVSSLLPGKSEGWIDLTQKEVIMTPGSAGSSAMGMGIGAATDPDCTPKKYTDLFHTQYGLNAFYDLQEGLDCAKKTGKPVFIDFTGKFCSNCKKMEAQVWSDPTVQGMLRNDFILIALYTDVNSGPYKLPEEEWYTSKVDGKVKKTIGQQNIDYEISMFNTNTVPLYVIMDSQGNVVNEPSGTNLDVASYTEWMKDGLVKATE